MRCVGVLLVALLAGVARGQEASLLEREGGSAATEAAVASALGWLGRHQAPDGRWEGAGWRGRCQGSGCPEEAAGEAGVSDVAATSVATLAFLGNGHTHRFGPHKRVVNRALRWLREQQGEAGGIGLEPGRPEGLLGHLQATLALCEAWAVSRDFTLRRSAERALGAALAARTPGAGWGDPAWTAWAVQALLAAEAAGLPVPPEAYRDARVEAQGVDPAGAPVGASGAALCTWLLCGGSRDDPRALRQALGVLEAGGELGAPEHILCTAALFQLGDASWRRWNEATLLPLVGQQDGDGCAAGSFGGPGEGGRVYATALRGLALEAYYRVMRR